MIKISPSIMCANLLNLQMNELITILKEKKVDEAFSVIGLGFIDEKMDELFWEEWFTKGGKFPSEVFKEE